MCHAAPEFGTAPPRNKLPFGTLAPDRGIQRPIFLVRASPQRTMQDPYSQEITDLLALASDVKARLRQLEGVGDQALDRTNRERPESGVLGRVRNHLELAIEALGAPTWGFASSTASLPITGFYSSSIYKALKDLRERKGHGNGAQPSTEATRLANRPQAISADPIPSDGLPQPPVKLEPNDRAQSADEEPSAWVKSRVDEIQRALSAAFGDDEMLPDEQLQPKPFGTPEFMGNTDTLSVPELVGFFQLQGKTGVLTVDARQEQFKLEYLRGELIHAGSSSSPDGERLGQILIQLGHLTEGKLQGLLVGKSQAERLGEALRRGEIISDEALAQALQVQVQRIFYRMFNLGGCRFTFREGLEGEPRARVRYNVTRLLLETARHHDEIEQRRDSA